MYELFQLQQHSWIFDNINELEFIQDTAVCREIVVSRMRLRRIRHMRLDILESYGRAYNSPFFVGRMGRQIFEIINGLHIHEGSYSLGELYTTWSHPWVLGYHIAPAGRCFPAEHRVSKFAPRRGLQYIPKVIPD